MLMFPASLALLLSLVNYFGKVAGKGQKLQSVEGLLSHHHLVSWGIPDTQAGTNHQPLEPLLLIPVRLRLQLVYG